MAASADKSESTLSSLGVNEFYHWFVFNSNLKQVVSTGVVFSFPLFVSITLDMIEGMPLKRRRVSFGGHLRPELFDENLPPNTPLKRGETPMKRRSLVTHTATTALKKIIKVRPIASLLPSEDSHPCSSQE